MAYDFDKMWVAIDSLVFGFDPSSDQLKLLLFPRKVEPFAGEWSLIGGMVSETEDLQIAAARILKSFTGLEEVFLEQLSVFGKSQRDPGGRVISILYWSLIKLDAMRKVTPNIHGAKWFSLDRLPDLVLDHQNMVNLGIKKLLSNARMSPIGFELLPEQFTLPQLKKLYDAIYQQCIDDRNFRKKILSTNLLVRLDLKDKSTSKKGAFLYKFNKNKYEALRKAGFLLDFNIKSS
jgi:8-oxo-dGTP diphosphatase